MKGGTDIARALFVGAIVLLLIDACGRRSETVATSGPQTPSPAAHVASDRAAFPPSAPSGSAPRKIKPRTMRASWYDVPSDSLAARRAAPGELTAAHDHYALGTRLRVTHAENGRSVVVRVTDRGVPRGKAPLDLCKRAAEQLDMLREGTAKVRVEVLPEEEVAGAPPSDSPSAAAQP